MKILTHHHSLRLWTGGGGGGVGVRFPLLRIIVSDVSLLFLDFLSSLSLCPLLWLLLELDSFCLFLSMVLELVLGRKLAVDARNSRAKQA